MKKKRGGFFTQNVLSNLVVVCFGVLLYFALTNFGALRDAAGRLLAIISPFVIGALIAFLLDIPMRFFERRLYSGLRHRRTFAILTTYVSAIVLLVLLFWLVVPQLVESTISLLGNANLYLANLNELMDWIGKQFNLEPESVDQFLLSYEDLVKQLFEMVRGILPDILNFSMRVGSGLVSILTALIASVYMLAGKEKLFLQCRRGLYAFAPRRGADATARVFRLSAGVFSGFISGKLLDSAIIGLICFVCMSLINGFFIEMPFIPLISVIVAVTNVIPFFGPFIGAIPSAMILLMVNPMSALWFAVFIIVLQQFDGNFLGPKILGDSTGLPALWVLIAIVVGGGLFGFPGMIMGVPAVAVLHTLFSELINTRLRGAGGADGTSGTDGVDTVDSAVGTVGAGEADSAKGAGEAGCAKGAAVTADAGEAVTADTGGAAISGETEAKPGEADDAADASPQADSTDSGLTKCKI
jgi:predicted PurR-regulated permease PerM